ncbi:hypothetical protein BDN67DRAFT_1003970 [Paxillus ammoniavirescens]|nr:hypothetical protein BDN67DRAFT_1003970 [Paxillus ammoniavirescens]
MPECGICLDALKTPVSIPCGHVHCQKCLRAHIGSGADALKSTCPTCRNPFYIATPDFAFVPKKYHDFILPSVRKIYMDISSVTALRQEVEGFTHRLERLAKEKEDLLEQNDRYSYALEEIAAQRDAALEEAEEARREAADIRKKYESLKKKHSESQSRDNASSVSYSSQNLNRRSSQNLDNARDRLPKVEDISVSLESMTPDQPRPKRALPKSRLSHSVRHRDEHFAEPPPQFVKRQRTSRHSDIGP